MTPELARSSPNYHTMLTGGHLNLDRFNVHRPSSYVAFLPVLCVYRSSNMLGQCLGKTYSPLLHLINCVNMERQHGLPNRSNTSKASFTLYREKLTGALYGLVESFFKNDEGHNVTVNGDRYRAMMTNFFIPELNNHDVQELWFQQDGATCHTARATIDLLKDTFGDRLNSRFGPVNWPQKIL
ncbi:uncharacterized protein TNCV_4324971 [Trichonephila clavipes]|nr:uncharacterized protein TNCV_4324971 [Trichonephila clavipes]